MQYLSNRNGQKLAKCRRGTTICSSSLLESFGADVPNNTDILSTSLLHKAYKRFGAIVYNI